MKKRVEKNEADITDYVVDMLHSTSAVPSYDSVRYDFVDSKCLLSTKPWKRSCELQIWLVFDDISVDSIADRVRTNVNIIKGKEYGRFPNACCN